MGGASCATTTSTTRELPIGLGTLGSYLDGCQSEAGDDGIARTRCPDGIMFAARTRTVGVAEPQYRSEAFGMAAQVEGARLVWDQVSVATEGPSGVVDRARALTPGSDDAKATLVGVVRAIGSASVEEMWCTASDAAGAQRCQDLIGVVLSRSTEAAPTPGGDEETPSQHAADASTAAQKGADTSASTSTSTSTSTRSSTVAGAGAGAVTLFGRSVSLPTTCSANKVADGVDAKCSDGASLSWRAYDEMDDAANMLHATLEALGNAEDGAPYACTIAGESAQCEEHERAAAGLAYVDGKPVAVLCLNVATPRAHSLCKAVLVPAKR